MTMQIDLENPFAMTVRSVIESYAQKASDSGIRAICDPHRLTYILMTLPNIVHSLDYSIVAIVRLIAGWVIIDQDKTAAPLVDLLTQKGIQREKIVLAHEGEPMPNMSEILATLLKREVALYVARASDAVIYPVLDDERQTYVVVDVPNDHKADEVYVINMAHLAGDMIVIDEERVLDKPLYEALIWNAGIPRSQIVLAYAGEKLPPDDQPE